MAAFSQSIRVVLVFLVLATGACRKNVPTATGDSKTSNPETAAAPANADNGVAVRISSAQTMMKDGSLDEAAAELARIQQTTQNFTPAEAASYRQALQDAHMRALEGAQKGDPKAQAALQIIKASIPR